MSTVHNSQDRQRRATKGAVATMLVAAGAAIAGALGAAVPAHAEEYTYLAIVYSPATGAYGWANGAEHPSKPVQLRDDAMPKPWRHRLPSARRFR